jgi:hypothetical protein
MSSTHAELSLFYMDVSGAINIKALLEAPGAINIKAL